MTPETIRVRGYFNRVLKLPAQWRIAQPPHQAGIFPHGTVPVRSAWRVLAPMQNRLESRGGSMGNAAIHVVDRARPYLRSCGACGPVATGTTATAIFGIGARSPAAVWRWCGR